MPTLYLSIGKQNTVTKHENINKQQSSNRYINYKVKHKIALFTNISLLSEKHSILLTYLIILLCLPMQDKILNKSQQKSIP